MFWKIIVLGLNLTYEFEVCSKILQNFNHVKYFKKTQDCPSVTLRPPSLGFETLWNGKFWQLRFEITNRDIFVSYREGCFGHFWPLAGGMVLVISCHPLHYTHVRAVKCCCIWSLLSLLNITRKCRACVIQYIFWVLPCGASVGDCIAM